MTVFLGGLTLALSNLLASAGQTWIPMIIGTYTQTGSEGIYTFRFNQDNGEAEKIAATAAENPSFLAVPSDGKHLYAVNESGSPDDSVSAFEITEAGGLVFRNSLSTGGEAPCNVTAGCGLVLTANYTGGSISVFRTGEDGSLDKLVQKIEFPLTGPAPNAARQQSAHLHCVRFTPDSRFLFATDLGNDCIYIFGVSASEEPLQLIRTVRTAPGAGPRHLTFSSDGNFAYLITELSGEVMTFRHSGGDLQLLQTEDCNEAQSGASADIHLSPDGRFLYASDRRKNDGIAIFKIDGENGLLQKAGFQPTLLHPRNFGISPNGKFLLCACRDSDTIQVFAIDPQTGLLTDTNQNISVPKPVCILFPEAQNPGI